MYRWYLPTLGDIIQADESSLLRHSRQTQSHPSHSRVTQAWYGAIAAVNTVLAEACTTQPETRDGKDVASPLNTACDDSSALTGVILSGPVPIFDRATLPPSLAHWSFTGDPAHYVSRLRQLPSAGTMAGSTPHTNDSSMGDDPDQFLSSMVSLHTDDPQGAEPFCLVLSAGFSVVLTLALDEAQVPQFYASFDPDTIWQSWRALRSRLQLLHLDRLSTIEALVTQFAPQAPDPQQVMDFSQLMLLQQVAEPVAVQMANAPAAKTPAAKTPDSTTSGSFATPPTPARYSHKPLNLNRMDRLKLDDVSWQDVVPSTPKISSVKGSAQSHGKPSSSSRTMGQSGPTGNEIPQPQISSDVELLKAIAHEVRTPLTTIRTLTRLLLRDKQMGGRAIQHLQRIDQECTNQIDRFSLIFKAVELETSDSNRPHGPLATISLNHIFQHNLTRWQQQAQRRNLTLDIVLPQSLPNVMSDPTTLDQVLTGLMDRMTHTLPAGTLIQLSAVPAGHQLKLQFWAKPHTVETNGERPPETGVPLPDGIPSIFAPSLQSVGQLLMVQPETGNLSLNMDTTKHLFQSLGGKLVVRRTQQKGEVLTIFLPLEQTGPQPFTSNLMGRKQFC